MDNFGKLNMAASSVFVDATDSETVVAFALHAVTGDLGRCGGLGSKTLEPFLRTHFLHLHDKDGSGGGRTVWSRDPGEQGAVGSVHVHCGFHWTDRRTVPRG